MWGWNRSLKSMSKKFALAPIYSASGQKHMPLTSGDVLLPGVFSIFRMNAGYAVWKRCAGLFYDTRKFFNCVFGVQLFKEVAGPPII